MPIATPNGIEDKKAIDDAIHEVIVERYGDDWEKMEKLLNL